MSYARFGEDSDVYVYLGDNGYNCCACTLQTVTDSVFDEPDQMVDHLMMHRDVGDVVPQYCIDRLMDEVIAEEGKGRE